MSIKGNHMKLKDIIDIMVKSRCKMIIFAFMAQTESYSVKKNILSPVIHR